MEPYLLPPSRTYLRNIAELITGANRLLNSWSPKNIGTQPVQGIGTLKWREAVWKPRGCGPSVYPGSRCVMWHREATITAGNIPKKILLTIGMGF